MEECETWIAGYVDAAGGRVLYADLLAAIPGNLRKYVPAALRDMKARDDMRKQNRVEDEGVNFYVFRPGK